MSENTTKEDVITVLDGMGETVDSERGILELKQKLMLCKAYLEYEEFVRDVLGITIEDRMEKGRKENSRTRLERQQELKLARIEEARRKAEKEARLRSEEKARHIVEKEGRLKAAKEAKILEARRRTEEKARLRAKDEATRIDEIGERKMAFGRADATCSRRT
ncbi:hypothetical protein TNIN_78421 [Trichonephila inaurata madagascariensis]|uniref:Uncharacterized protein n=1 Tax=Trichonephila inaurata madagascariensis TaxID=2747483 RepID=A0A8X7C8Y6_9ARAC|nr:hypothetical protein TNIN_78421 [Trichonephila inaurata madagascariensis]